MLSDHERRFLLTRRVGHLATADSRAIPHVVPVCFTISQGTLYITIDEKPKRVAGPALKRVRNIERNPMVAIVVDRYDEDWTRLGWVMLRGRAEILRAGTEHDRAQELLRSRGDADRRTGRYRGPPGAGDELGQPVRGRGRGRL